MPQDNNDINTRLGRIETAIEDMKESIDDHQDRVRDLEDFKLQSFGYGASHDFVRKVEKQEQYIEQAKKQAVDHYADIKQLRQDMNGLVRRIDRAQWISIGILAAFLMLSQDSFLATLAKLFGL